MNKEWKNMLIFLSIFAVIVLIITFPDTNITGETIYYQNEDLESKDSLHWDHMPITYKIINKKECGTYEPVKIKNAFLEIEKATEKVVFFEEVNSSPDIEISCSFIEDCYERKIDIAESEAYYIETETICEHDTGIAQITDYSENKILGAKIEFIGLDGFRETDNKGPSGFVIGSCGHLNTELHEILHVLGYEHIEDENSIMNPYEESYSYRVRGSDECIGSKKEVDKEIIADLIYTYS